MHLMRWGECMHLMRWGECMHLMRWGECMHLMRWGECMHLLQWHRYGVNGPRCGGASRSKVGDIKDEGELW